MTTDSKPKFTVSDSRISVPRLFDDDRARRACEERLSVEESGVDWSVAIK